MMTMKIDFPSERVIEDCVCSVIDETGRCPISDESVSDYYRQHAITGYGVADVIKIHASPHIVYLTVLELKNTPLCEADLCQLSRYMVGLKRQASRYERRLNIHFEITGELAGPVSRGPGDWVYLLDLIGSEISVFEIWLDVKNGFQSKELGSGWHNPNENLSGGKQLARACYEARKLELAIEGENRRTNVVEIGDRNGKG